MPPGVTMISAGGIDLDAVVARSLSAIALRRAGVPAAGDVMGVAGVHRVGGGPADVGGGDEVGVAAAEIDDVDALRLQRAGLVGDGQRRRGREIAHPRGEVAGRRALGLGRHGCSSRSRWNRDRRARRTGKHYPPSHDEPATTRRILARQGRRNRYRRRPWAATPTRPVSSQSGPPRSLAAAASCETRRRPTCALV